MFSETKNKNKKHFCKSCLQCFSSKTVFTEHKKDSLSINGVQSVKLKKGTIKFKIYLKQIPVPFKIYADFESNLKDVEIYEGLYSKKISRSRCLQFGYKLVCIDDKFTKSIVVFRGKNAGYEFIKARVSVLQESNVKTFRQKFDHE